jgi:hypothetical protein
MSSSRIRVSAESGHVLERCDRSDQVERGWWECAVHEIAEHVSDAAGAVERSCQLDPDLIGIDADHERHQLPKSAGQHSFSHPTSNAVRAPAGTALKISGW